MTPIAAIESRLSAVEQDHDRTARRVEDTHGVLVELRAELAANTRTTAAVLSLLRWGGSLAGGLLVLQSVALVVLAGGSLYARVAGVLVSGGSP